MSNPKRGRRRAKQVDDNDAPAPPALPVQPRIPRRSVQERISGHSVQERISGHSVQEPRKPRYSEQEPSNSVRESKKRKIRRTRRNNWQQQTIPRKSVQSRLDAVRKEQLKEVNADHNLKVQAETSPNCLKTTSDKLNPGTNDLAKKAKVDHSLKVGAEVSPHCPIKTSDQLNPVTNDEAEQDEEEHNLTGRGGNSEYCLININDPIAMSTTDTLKLNKSAMFAKIRAGLPVERQQTQNLLDCKDDLLLAWDSLDSCLLVFNWRTVTATDEQEEITYQTLMPSSPQCFQVERVLASNDGTQVALAGPRGVAVLELPRRWGRNGQFLDGKSTITCRSTNLDALFFNNNPHLELRQLHWHPDSPTDSHLLLLLSDNTIRVYDNSTLRHVWPVGPLPMKGDSNSSMPSAYALGESAVDFDIAPAVKVGTSNTTLSCTTRPEADASVASVSQTHLQSNDSNASLFVTNGTKRCADKVEWPIVVLRENGNIYVLMAGMDTDKPRLQGPLTITPECGDNYGLDSCALLVIRSLPPTLVFAESNGRLHHALFLEAETAENSFNEIDSGLAIHPSEWTVHVLETVELELGLPKPDAIAHHYNCPIYLKKDFINELRYFAYHNAGLHVVNINFIGELERYLESNVNSDIATLSTPSRAEYILCTKIDTGERINAVLGFVLVQMPSGVVLLLGSGQVISLKLVIDPKLLVEPSTRRLTDNRGVDKQLDHVQEPSFVDQIKGMLRRTVTQPILSVDTAATPTTVECYELLTQAVEVLRTQYLNKHEVVRAEFTKRLNMIRLRKEQQHRDIENLELEREEIREQAHRLADRFEEISDHQELVTKRCQELVRRANTCLPCNAVSEKDFALEVVRINNSVKSMALAVQHARKSIAKQSYDIAKYNETPRQRSFELPDKQEKTIKDILMHLTAEIDGQIKEVKRINKLIGA